MWSTQRNEWLGGAAENHAPAWVLERVNAETSVGVQRKVLNGDLGETGLGETGLGETGLGETGLGKTGLGETGLGETVWAKPAQPKRSRRNGLVPC